MHTFTRNTVLRTPDNIPATALTWQQRFKVRLTVRTQPSAVVRAVVVANCIYNLGLYVRWAMKNVARGSRTYITVALSNIHLF